MSELHQRMVEKQEPFVWTKKNWEQLGEILGHIRGQISMVQRTLDEQETTNDRSKAE